MADVKFVVLLAARNWSERLTGKSTVEVCGRPILAHIIDRFKASDRVTDIVVCTSHRRDDDAIARICRQESVPCHRSDLSEDGDLVALLDEALQFHAPDASYVFRGLTDCVFVEPQFIDWRLDLLERRQADVVWPGLPQDPWPIYGARESPWSRRAWDETVRHSKGDETEHPGLFIYQNWRKFRVVYTEMLPVEYYRPYRLELDTAKDLEVVRALFEALWEPGGIVPMLEAVKWLDAHQDVAALNQNVPLRSITEVNWHTARGHTVWRCQKCGATPMLATTIRDRCLETECPNCGHPQPFVEVPAFLAERR